MKAIHKRRLLKLAKHLRSGKLGHARFDFRRVNADAFGNELWTNGCGAVGCAIGECPIVFPEHWRFVSGQPNLNRAVDGSFNLIASFEAAKEFFNLTREEVSHLFAPKQQKASKFRGIRLGKLAKKEQVAANIEAFVKLKSKTQ